MTKLEANEKELLVGQSVPDDDGGFHAAKTATLFGPSVDASDLGTGFAAAAQWVIPTGGAFLFAPSLAFVDKFASGGGSWGVKVRVSCPGRHVR